MAYRITYKRSVARDLARLDKPTQRRILDKIEAELSADSLKLSALKGSYAGLRRLWVGNSCVIYAALEAKVLVLRIGHRREVYR
ncbi:MAG: addiction module toxin RelE [Calditrichaeota bacterium]|nr:addiction module toxin RelE [Calditrichota bacterium]